METPPTGKEPFFPAKSRYAKSLIPVTIGCSRALCPVATGRPDMEGRMPLSDERVIDGIAALVTLAGKEEQIVHGRHLAEDYLARHPDCGMTVEQLSQLITKAAVAAGMPVEFGD